MFVLCSHRNAPKKEMSKQVKNPEADNYYPATKSTYLNPEVLLRC